MPAESPTAATAVLDEEALVRQHLPIVQYEVSDLRRRLPEHVNVDDLTSAGMAALALAARSYDPAHGVPFGRYAARRISGALLDELRAHDWASRSVRRKAREHADAAGQLSQALGRPASTSELAFHLGVPATEVQNAQNDVHRAVVLSWQALVDVTGEEPALPSGGPSPEAVLLSREREAYLRDAVASLPERLNGVIHRLYFEDATLQEVAAELDVTESRVSQMRTEAMSLLRDAMNANLSPEQLEPEALPDGRVARRKAAYYATVASRSTWQSRLTAPTSLVGSAPSSANAG
jgi:RNA polymerase sigma factor for flagellar operon FliA